MKQSSDPVEVAPDGAIDLIETVNSGPSKIERGSEALCALFLITMIVLIGAEAIARNIFATSLQITDEVGGYLLVALTFLSMSVAEAHGAFHRVELIQSRLKRSAQLISQIVFDIISLAASLLVTWQLARVAMNSWRSEDVAPTPLQTPLWIPQSVMSIGMALLCFALVRTIWAKAQRIRGSASS
jgi:TRAP-type C4-dicarboxylate transport system permease small subunit